MPDTSPVHVVAVLTAKPGQRAALLDAFAEIVPAVLSEVGCITYVPTIDVPGSTDAYGADTVVVVEKWASADDLEAHRVAPHMQAFGKRVADIVATRKVHVLRAAA